jgi:orotate phosphoribosyltransferase
MRHENAKLRLVALLKHLGYAAVRPDKPFRLASGTLSPYYYNIKAALLDGRCLRALRECLPFYTAGHGGFWRVGGVDAGARPLVALFAEMLECPGFVLRKEKKDHGTESDTDGELPKQGESVLLVDDVVTTGASMMRLVERVGERTSKTCVFSVVNRLGHDLPDPCPEDQTHLLTQNDFWPGVFGK